MARFIFVSGAFHSAWCWELVIPLLEARGHRAEAIDLPGMGADRTPFAETSFADWAQSVVTAAESDLEKPILVGHSRGGVVISQAAELAPDKLRMNVYLAALLVGDGKTALDPQERQGIDISQMAQPNTPDGLAMFATPELTAVAYENSSAELLARAHSHVTPEPAFALTTPLSLSAERYGSVKRAYLECLQDKVVPLDVQRSMQALEPCQLVRSIDTDHCPNYSAPELVTEALDDIAGAA
ncbi:MAG: alpha/beta fold hydrolase [Novosphingobium sp.]|nr:alpha/beta fold hydrolase [Novosphingobium sp.]